MAKKVVETPLMKQYYEIKAKHPDAVLLFRVGDFYETFSDDAIIASEILGITLTRRANGSAQFVELAGFPHHALDTYLPKLVRAGKRVAICDQLEDPKTTKTLVKRGVTELVTPGVSIGDNILNHRENNFLASVHFSGETLGISFLDISTGEFFVAQGSGDAIDKLLHTFMPKEVLVERACRRRFEGEFGSRFLLFEMEDWIFQSDTAEERLKRHFETVTLKGFGIHNLPCGIVAAGAILYYLDNTHHHQIGHVTALSRIEEDRFVRLDKFTIRSLELLGAMNEGGKGLLDILDRTITPMGSRLMRRWILFPLKELKPIQERHDVVQYFTQHDDVASMIEHQLALIGDLERIISKVAVGRVTPREILQIKVALEAMIPIKEQCLALGEPTLQSLGEQINLCPSMRERIEREISLDTPAMVAKGGVIRQGVDPQLDELRQIAFHGKDYLMKIQQRESEATGIPSLKIAFNNVFGYYIEVRNTHKDKVPEGWIRKQTLVSAERYITQELKEYEEKIMGAEQKILALETQLLSALVSALMEYVPSIQSNAQLLARLDTMQSLSRVAKENGYVRPHVDDSDVLEIKGGRHPVIERLLPPGESYVDNDLAMENNSAQILMITGPNMAGKSALLRQTALIVLMAQMGSFVPATSATVGLVDKIFTRVGASDNISLGESTFMVEMAEASDILNNVTPKSLILFDELGRGTSTYDGISIAWAIVEYLHEQPRARAKTLFATHYHELNEMEQTFPRIVNYNVSVRELSGKIVFLRKLVKGGSEHSFGIHVAKMAGMPQRIVKRSNEILKQLEGSSAKGDLAHSVEHVKPSEGMQLSFFQLDDPVVSEVRKEIVGLDINNLTPIEALNKLNEIRKIILGK